MILTETMSTDPSDWEVLQRQYYYPFGMPMQGVWQNTTDPRMDYLYNGKELEEELSLHWLAYGFRHYDPVVGRFTGVDPIADQFAWVSPFNYAENEPIGNIDLWGLQAVSATESPVDKGNLFITVNETEFNAFKNSSDNENWDGLLVKNMGEAKDWISTNLSSSINNLVFTTHGAPGSISFAAITGHVGDIVGDNYAALSLAEFELTGYSNWIATGSYGNNPLSNGEGGTESFLSFVDIASGMAKGGNIVMNACNCASGVLGKNLSQAVIFGTGRQDLNLYFNQDLSVGFGNIFDQASNSYQRVVLGRTLTHSSHYSQGWIRYSAQNNRAVKNDLKGGVLQMNATGTPLTIESNPNH